MTNAANRLGLAILCLLYAAPTPAQYVVAPDIAREYLSLRERVAAQPADAELQFEYAICLSYIGKIEDGRAALKRVRELDPQFAHTALPRYLQRHRDAPQEARARYRLAFLYYFNENYDEALRHLEFVAQQQPIEQLNAWALGYMAVIKGKQKRWDEAERLVRRALAIEPHAYALHAALAAALKKQGEWFAASRAYLTALSARSDFEDYERRHLR
jgi:tetratricopeptide (TPR) repeat protein